MIKYIDTPTYLTDNPTATYADLMQNCVQSMLEEIFPNATTYFLDGNYPCVGIPLQGESTTSGKLHIRCSGSATTTVSTSTIGLEVYFGTQKIDPYLYAVTSSNYSGGKNSSQNPKSAGWVFSYVSITDGYCFGIKSQSSVSTLNCSSPIFVTRFKKGDSYVDGIFTNTASENTPFIVVINDDGNIRADTVYIQRSVTARQGLGQVFPLQMQDYKHDYLYFYSGQSNPSMKGSWFAGYELLRQDTYQNNIWYENAFTIDEQAFDAMVCSDGSYLGVCKKHIADNPNA